VVALRKERTLYSKKLLEREDASLLTKGKGRFCRKEQKMRHF